MVGSGLSFGAAFLSGGTVGYADIADEAVTLASGLVSVEMPRLLTQSHIKKEH
jgi:hypothetical protein